MSSVLKSIELSGFKSFAKKTALTFDTPVTAIVGPNGSGKSNIVEAIRFVLGEQSMKSLRGKGGVDLIFKGSKNLSALSRASVTITFDNRKRIFSFTQSDSKIKSLDFDEIRVSREVYSDGANRYLINETEVRLKDIVEMLASVHIGSSGHHIISQGEADRILNASSKDRRQMIEDALGLKIYQYRIKESERRLDKTEINMKEVAGLRRELAPHLQYLKKQVEKIEKAHVLRDELIDLYMVYGSREFFRIKTKTHELKTKRHEIEEKLSHVIREMGEAEAMLTPNVVNPHQQSLETVEEALQNARINRDTVSRSLARLEGVLEALSGRTSALPTHNDHKQIPWSLVQTTLKEVLEVLEDAEGLEDADTIKNHLFGLREKLHGFITRHNEEDHSYSTRNNEDDVVEIRNEVEKLHGELSRADERILELETKKREVEHTIREYQESLRTKERGYYEAKAKRQEFENELEVLYRDERELSNEELRFQEEMREGVALLGNEMPKDFREPDESFSLEELHTIQEEIRRKIERIKIKLEESGGLGGGETMKEYEETLTRDQFLSRELGDLETAIRELRELIVDLKAKLDGAFNEGIQKINTEFQTFFSLMFGGGSAHLTITTEHKRPANGSDDEDTDEALNLDDEELEFERGIEINVSLPHKKVRELTMLSGGERSLTSIALLFAMSQVNPPPFLVLDETDAALDEANSRRYGDMIESLSRLSQLIVVTHNRETMSHASVLYGITIGADGGSKLLSIKLEEASAYAK